MQQLSILRIAFFTIILTVLFGSIVLYSQQDMGRFSGNAQIEAQSYRKDSAMGTTEVKEQIQSIGYFNLNYVNGGLSAGIRYEYYLNPLASLEQAYAGQGIAHRFINYSNDFIEITAGNFYEQFGSGIIFRTYEEKALGIDNAMDGARFKIKPTDGLSITGIWGKQRHYWGLGAGIVRGGDLNISFNELFPNTELPGGANITAGASAVSVFQEDRNPNLFLPENTLAWSGRAAIAADKYAIDAEYAYKYNSPYEQLNANTFNPGYGFILNGSYFEKGFSATLNLHKIDNMDYRSDRGAGKSETMLNYIPAIAKQHSYRLVTMYPYSTQMNGEAGLQAEVQYKIPRNSLLGGQYGTDVALNYSRIHSNDTTMKDKYTYDSPLLGVGNQLYFQDINLSIQHKFSNQFKSTLALYNIIYDRDRLEESGAPHYGKVNANIIVADGTYSFAQKYAIKVELSHQWYTQDSTAHAEDIINGNWLGMLAEFTISPGWFITLYDDWNYGNESEDRQIHYLNGSVAYSTGSTRLSLGYGKQRAGILCIGGVCRPVPASNGFYLSINTAF